MQAQQGVSTSRKICIRLLPSTMKVGALQELLAKEEDTVKRLVKVFDRKSLQNSPRYSCICI